MREFVGAHPVLAVTLSGLWSAVVVDLIAFLKWQTWDDGKSFSVKLALLRYIQGALSAFLGTLGVAGAAAGAGGAAVVLWWLA